MANPRLLITRFAPHAQRLANLLNEQGIYSLAQPLLQIKPISNDSAPFVQQYDFIIAISCNAVKYTNQALLGAKWPISNYLAVGHATKSLLEEKTQQSVNIPVDSFTSEGLLALPVLNKLDNSSVLILRGVAGREFLKDELLTRGARVDYYESYQRVAIKLSRSSSVYKWQQHAINGVIITSVELFEQLISLTNAEDIDWLQSLTLFSASERILQYAHSLGFHKTALLPSIADQDIIDYFTDEGSYDRD